MLKTKRDYRVTDEINRLEKEWWDKNSHTVNRLWDMEESLSWALRKRYLKKLEQFFKNTKKEQLAVVEIGCGSGWVGQFIAGERIRIVGWDFSSEQIKQAKLNASRKNLDKYCNYYNGDWLKLLDSLEEIDGVLFHSFLHHLDGQEIDALLTQLKGRLQKNTKIWIYEPAFYLGEKNDVASRSILASILMGITSYILSFFQWGFVKYNLLDKEAGQAFGTLQLQAKDKGWYLSPKEVPFSVEDFSKQLDHYFKITNQYWATIYIISRLAKIGLIKNKIIRHCITKFFVPLFELADYFLTQEKSFLKHKIIAPSYAFYVWECIV